MTKTIPDPKAIATSEEEIADIFGVKAGEALVIQAEGIVIVLQADGKVLWKAEGIEVTQELIAKILAYAMNAAALKALINELKVRKQKSVDSPYSGLSNMAKPGKNNGVSR